MLEHFNKWPNSEARGWQRANDKRFRWSSQDQSANDKRFRPSHPEGAPPRGRGACRRPKCCRNAQKKIQSLTCSGTMKSMLAQAKEFMGVEGASKPVLAGSTFVFVWFDKTKHRVFMDVGSTTSAFEMQLYLATGVMPSRQKLLGFQGGNGPQAALQPNADMRTLQVREGMELRLTQLPYGQEIEPQTLTTHEVDKIGAKCLVLEEQVNAIEACALVKRLDTDPCAKKRLHAFSMFLHEHGQRVLLKIDGIAGGDAQRMARKALVVKMNHQLGKQCNNEHYKETRVIVKRDATNCLETPDRLEILKKALDPSPPPPPPSPQPGAEAIIEASGTGSNGTADPHDDLSASEVSKRASQEHEQQGQGAAGDASLGTAAESDTASGQEGSSEVEQAADAADDPVIH